VPAEPDPARAEGGLTRPADRYAGAYANEHWGTLEVLLAGRELSGRIGNVRLSFHRRGADRFHANAPGTVASDARFVVADGEVRAVEVRLSGWDVVFERRR
jgi:hypothetical protein